MRKRLPSTIPSAAANDAPRRTGESLHLVAKTSPVGSTPQKPSNVWRVLGAAATIVRAVEGIHGVTVGDPVGTPLCMDLPIFFPRVSGEMFVESGLWQRVISAAHDLETNALRSEPLRHAALLRDVSPIKLLAASARYCEVVEAAFVDRDGTHPIPALPSQCFDEPTERETREFSGLKQVTGFELDKSNACALLRLDHSSVCVFPNPELVDAVRSLSIPQLENGVCIEGRWLRAAGGEWQTQPGARLVFQRELALTGADEPDATK